MQILITWPVVYTVLKFVSAHRNWADHCLGCFYYSVFAMNCTKMPSHECQSMESENDCLAYVIMSLNSKFSEHIATTHSVCLLHTNTWV